MTGKHEELAMIKDISFGCRDRDHCALWFTVELLHGAALQRLGFGDAITIIEKHNITDINHLNGKLCIVETDGTDVKFKELK